MKRSAGILPYKFVNGNLYVYLERPGGPFWEGKDKWSICKGEYKEEKAIEAAVREFQEESSFSVKKNSLRYLCSTKMKGSNKLVTTFIINEDFDANKMKSNTFRKEFPRGSGIINTYPEMDEARWFRIDEAYNKIFDSQRIILFKLEQRLQ